MPSEVKPLAPRANRATIALAAVCLAAVLTIVFDLLEMRLMDRLIAGEDVPASDLEADDTRQLIVSSVGLVAYLAAIG